MPALKNIRHEKAIQAYLSNGGNKSAAYREVYKGSVKWSEGVVWRRASELFIRGDVEGRIKEIQEKLSKKQIISKEAIIKDLEVMASVTIEDYIETVNFTTEKVTWKDTKLWTHAMKRACTGIKPTRNGIELTVSGVEYAYNRIAKMMGYDAPVKTINVESTLADLLKD